MGSKRLRLHAPNADGEAPSATPEEGVLPNLNCLDTAKRLVDLLVRGALGDSTVPRPTFAEPDLAREIS